MKMPRVEKPDEFYRCHFCGCHTNARLRACCELGRATDLKRIEPELVERWEKEAEAWLPEGMPPIDLEFEVAKRLVGMYAGRVLVLLDELKRLRGCRDGMGELAQELTIAKRLLRSGVSRANEAKRILDEGGRTSEALRVFVDTSWYFVDGLRYCVYCESINCRRQIAEGIECGPLEGKVDDGESKGERFGRSTGCPRHGDAHPGCKACEGEPKDGKDVG